MQQTIQQPATHSLLRQSQRRRQSESRLQPNSSPSTNLRPQNTNKQKYHYNYSRSSNPSSHKKGISSSLYESKYVSKPRESQNVSNHTQHQQANRETNIRYSMIMPSTQEKLVVCQALPKSKPKYSFTFTNLPVPQNSTQLNHYTPRASLPVNEQTNLSNRHSSSRSPDIRKDMDMCLYSITDKLKEIEEQQNQTKNFIESKFRSDQQDPYRPSISQIRKNKKMYLDKSIHRIHPEIVNQYIETVYREYDIPDPLKSGERTKIENDRVIREIPMFEINEKKEIQQKIIPKNHQAEFIKTETFVEKPLVHRQQTQISSSRIKTENNIENPVIAETEPSKTLNKQILQKPFRHDYYLHNSKLPSNQRKNNLISTQQNQQQSLIKNRKKKFLDLTLSKEKNINPKKFTSPQLANKPGSKQQKSSRSHSERSKSRHSNSQKKILQIKNNIATWNDHEHQYAERYSYLQSPYEMIRQSKPQSSNQDSNQGPVNIRIRPFEEMMKATVPTEANNTTQNSQFLESKYVQSFFTQEGEVMEEFRFCILCELPVLSANISKHEEKCIGWINEKGILIEFKDLYKVQNEEELKQVIHGKIDEIKKRMTQKIAQLKEKQKLDPNQRNKLTSNIIQSVQNLVETFILMTDIETQSNQSESMFSSGYKKIQQNYKSEYILLLQESKKLHWFVKLLENYEKRVERLNVTNEGGIKRSKGFTSTKAKHNQSLTFIEEEEQNQVISEFGSQREH